MLRPFQAVEDIMDAKSVLKTDLQRQAGAQLLDGFLIGTSSTDKGRSGYTSLSEKSGYFLHAPWIGDCKKEEFT